MRNSFVDTFMEISKKDDNIFLLTGDLGFSVFEGFRDSFPERFFDVGVAEQNMVGIAAGLSFSGKTVLVYSIIPFVTMRCFEQIRNDVCMHDLNVKFIGMGAGLHYGPAGPSHHAIEDIGLMRALPNMTVIVPGSPKDTEGAISAAFKIKTPAYIRLSKSAGEIENLDGSTFELGKSSLVRDGKELVIISCGDILHNTIAVADKLESEGISTRIINMHTIKPIDCDVILKAAEEAGKIVVVEEHSVIGGLGSAVAEVLTGSGLRFYFKHIGLDDSFVKKIGSRDFLLKENGLNSEAIYQKIKDWMEK